jgi:hypothetical protein
MRTHLSGPIVYTRRSKSCTQNKQMEEDIDTELESLKRG